MKGLAALVMLVIQIIGIVVANGFWSTFFAIFVPLWGWYLGIEHLLIRYGLL